MDQTKGTLGPAASGQRRERQTGNEAGHLPDGSATSVEGARRCRAVVVTCVDYRFVEPLHRFLEGEGLAGAADVIAWPGGAVAMSTNDAAVLEGALAQACALHDPREVILIAHHDCGRIGGSGRFPGREAEIATLETALAIASENVAERFPALRIRLVRFDERGPVPVGISRAWRAARDLAGSKPKG